jgi:hypothetical protein
VSSQLAVIFIFRRYPYDTKLNKNLLHLYTISLPLLRTGFPLYSVVYCETTMLSTSKRCIVYTRYRLSLLHYWKHDRKCLTARKKPSKQPPLPTICTVQYRYTISQRKWTIQRLNMECRRDVLLNLLNSELIISEYFTSNLWKFSLLISESFHS